MFKVFERLLKPRLEWWAESGRLLSPRQFGFRKGLSTADAIGTFQASLLKSYSRQEYVAARFTDIASAYNSVQPGPLLDRLKEAGAPDLVTANIGHIIHRRATYATFNGSVIGRRYTDIGLEQGWVMAPFLYIFDKRQLCEDLPDEVVLYARGHTPAQAQARLIECATVFLSRLRRDVASLSPGKSTWCFFSRRRLPADPAPLVIGDDVIPYQPH